MMPPPLPPLSPSLSPGLFVFADLDDSLMSTRHAEGSAVRPASVSAAGEPHSWHSHAQVALLDWLAPATWIPVTGRCRTNLDRVLDLGFSWYRITSHGAVVWDPHGCVEPAWMQAILPQAQAWEPLLLQFIDRAQREITRQKASAMCRMVHDGGIAALVSIKGPPAQIDALAQTLVPHWPAQVHHNQHRLVMLPPYASKAAAVRWVQARAREQVGGNAVFLGIGDSHSDLGFMRECDFAVMPKDSQILRTIGEGCHP